MAERLNHVWIPSSYKKVDLFVSSEQYSKLVEQRKEQKDAYGRIVIKLEPLAKQG